MTQPEKRVVMARIRNKLTPVEPGDLYPSLAVARALKEMLKRYEEKGCRVSEINDQDYASLTTKSIASLTTKGSAWGFSTLRNETLPAFDRYQPSLPR